MGTMAWYRRTVGVVVGCIGSAVICAALGVPWRSCAHGVEPAVDSLDALTLALLCEPEQKAGKAASELSRRADASRKWFEVFLLASLRKNDSGMPLVPSVQSYAEDWSKRYRGQLRYLEDDANSIERERSFMARSCLGLLRWRDFNRYYTPGLLNLVGNIYVVHRLDNDVPLKDLFLVGLEGTWLLSGQCAVQNDGNGVAPASIEIAVEKTTGLPVIWYPSSLRPSRKVDLPRGDPNARDPGAGDRVSVSYLLGNLVTAGLDQKSDPNTTECFIVPTRRAILLIGLPRASREVEPKLGSYRDVVPEEPTLPTTQSKSQ